MVKKLLTPRTKEIIRFLLYRTYIPSINSLTFATYKQISKAVGLKVNLVRIICTEAL